MKTNPWERFEKARANDVEMAHRILDDPEKYPEGCISYEWAKRVIDNENKAIAKKVAT